jgi:uncharacterized protein YjbI with pentapeptide repeats
MIAITFMNTWRTCVKNGLFRGADLRGADLRGVNLQGADLRGVNLQGCVGNGKEIKHTTEYFWNISWTKNVLQIGCQQYSVSEWSDFNDEQISKMAHGALEFWRDHKESIMELMRDDN